MMCLHMFSRSKYFSLGDKCELQEIGEVVDDKHDCFILLRFLLRRIEHKQLLWEYILILDCLHMTFIVTVQNAIINWMKVGYVTHMK